MTTERSGHLRKLLVGWFGATIVATGIALGLVAWALSPEPSRWRHTVEDLQAFVGDEFALVWDDPAQRSALARRTASGLDVEVVLRDASGAEIERHGAACVGHGITAPVDIDGVVRGSVEACWRHEGRAGWALVLGLVAAAGVLWAAAGLLARRLTQPFDRLTEFANRLADGDLDARVDLGDRPRGEPAIVAAALNDMAVRVQEQIAEGRALLAAVSHEIRTPLGHLRVLVELLRERGADERALADIEREVGDLDALVSKLLADARLQFAAVTRTRLSANAIAARALAQAGLDAELLIGARDDDDSFDADPTLLARALGNLLENAAAHGGGARALRVELDDDDVTFAVDDDGSGFDETEIERAFDPFVRGTGHGSGSTLGLGLSLVQRIALAHGGTAWIRNRDGGGATVAFSVRRGA
jgi:signal transduction histidine kinase